MEAIRRRYPKTKMAVHRRRHLAKWAVWNRYTRFKGLLWLQFHVLPKPYYWHKRKDNE